MLEGSADLLNLTHRKVTSCLMKGSPGRGEGLCRAGANTRAGVNQRAGNRGGGPAEKRKGADDTAD